MLKISEFFELIIQRKFLNFERILTELRSEMFEWFDHSPIEPFNLGGDRGDHLAENADEQVQDREHREEDEDEGGPHEDVGQRGLLRFLP